LSDHPTMVGSRPLGNTANSRDHSCRAGSKALPSTDSLVRTCTDSSVCDHRDNPVHNHTESTGYRSRLGHSLERKRVRELHLTSRQVSSNMRLVVLPQAILERGSISYPILNNGLHA
jgi:hypothetical protein